MRINLVGAFIRNAPFGTEIAFAKGLRRRGHEVYTLDPDYLDREPDLHPDADASIVFKWLPEGKVRDIWQTLRGPKIVFQPDDLRFPHIQQMMEQMRAFCDHALIFDDGGEAMLSQQHYLKVQKLLVTADDEIYRPRPEVKQDLDLVFVGSMSNGPNHRGRMRMLEILKKTGNYYIGYVNELFDVDAITTLYSRAKVVLNHATDIGQPFGCGYGFQCRHFEVGMTRCCLLSNKLVYPDPTLQSFETYDSESSLISKVDVLLNDQKRREQLAFGLYEEIRLAHMPEHRADQIVKFVEGL